MEVLLEHLRALVAFDTQNPPRNIAADHPIFGYCRDQLPGFAIEVEDHGMGRVSFLATRGYPKVLFNVHLDTVPCGEGWTHPPLELHIADGRAYGRGSCDIKGAAACLLTLAGRFDGPLALLFTTDEEGANGCCVSRFCDDLDPDRYRQIVVAEPTRCEAVTEHRGYLSVVTRFKGQSGHSSEARALRDNAIHRAAHWMSAAIEHARGLPERPCFNVGRIEGGTKSNVIADEVTVRWSARLPGTMDNDAYLKALISLDESASATWEKPFSGPTLPGRQALDGARLFIREHELDEGPMVDFWTEASLFAQSGVSALVLGPGDIAQAHTIDEWVELAQLERAYEIYERIAGGQ